MARTKKPEVVYSRDFVGVWLYLVTPDGFLLLRDNPIIDPAKQAAFTKLCRDASADVQAWHIEQRTNLHDIGQ